VLGDDERREMRRAKWARELGERVIWLEARFLRIFSDWLVLCDTFLILSPKFSRT